MTVRRSVPVLAVPMAIAAFLRLWNLDDVGFGNQYYAATVKSMTTSVAAFLYGSFDPQLFVTVDKPAPGLWAQAIAASIFGFAPLTLLLPQAIAGVLSVVVIGRIVSRDHGTLAGAVAALALAVAPVSVAVDRNNTMDSVLVLVLLLAVWSALRSLQDGSRWLLAAAGLVGLGFNLKMSQAYLVVPAIVVTYALASRARPLSRGLQLAAFCAVTLAVSVVWIAFVDLTPADARPFVGSSRDNTALELAIGHNGLARVPQELLFWTRPAAQDPAPPAVPFVPAEVGERGAFRLFNEQLAGQVTWYLPIAVVGAAAALTSVRRWPRDGAGANVVLWLAWLVPAAILFSWSGLFHRYYLVMLAAPLAALVGIGAASLIAAARASVAWRIGVVLTAATTAALHIAIVARADAYASWLVPVIIAGALACAIAVVSDRMRAVAIALSISSSFAAPVVWAATTLVAFDAGLPFAGPELVRAAGGGPRAPAPIGLPVPPRSPLLEFLLAEHRGERWIAAASSAMTAAPLMLRADVAVMALGGFNGQDPILDPARLERIVREGELRFIVAEDRMRPDLLAWVRSRCGLVVPSRFAGAPAQPPRPGEGAISVFDCARVRSTTIVGDLAVFRTDPDLSRYAVTW